VLERLGAPETWVPGDERPAWRSPLEALRSGPEDWRLTYLTFISFLAGPALFFSPKMFWPLPPVLFAASVLLARASLALLDDHHEPVGPRRWLIYPPLVAVYFPVAVVLVAWPLLLGPSAIVENSQVRDQLARAFSGPLVIVASAVIALALGLWWIVMGAIASVFTAGLRAAFWPLADWLERRHATRLAIAGLLVAIVAGATLLL
jgi:hypothetical protein